MFLSGEWKGTEALQRYWALSGKIFEKLEVSYDIISVNDSEHNISPLTSFLVSNIYISMTHNFQKQNKMLELLEAQSQKLFAGEVERVTTLHSTSLPSGNWKVLLICPNAGRDMY